MFVSNFEKIILIRCGQYRIPKHFFKEITFAEIVTLILAVNGTFVKKLKNKTF